LIEENSHLKHQLEKREQNRATAPAAATGTGNATSTDKLSENDKTFVSCEEYQHLAERFEELYKKQQEVMQRIKYVERKNIAVMQKNKEMKERVLDWQKYLSKGHKPKLQGNATAEHPKVTKTIEEHPPPPLPSSPASSIVKTPRALRGISSPAPVSSLANSGANIPNEVSAPVIHEGSHARALQDIGSESHEEDQLPQLMDNVHEGSDNVPQEMAITSASEHPTEPGEQAQPDDKITSSQTEDDVMQDAEVAMPPPRNVVDDDVPQVVSERSLKRKRKASTTIHVYNDRIPSDGTPAKPYRVKEEPLSSPPAPQPSHKLLRKETLDLDELGPHVISTSHGRRLRSHATNIATLRHQRSTSVPLIKEERVEGGDTEVHNAHLKSLEPAVAEARALSEPFAPARGGVKPLTEIDSNLRMTVDDDERMPNKRHKNEVARLRTMHNILAESGEEPPPVDENDTLLTPKAARARYNNRLNAARAVQTPAKKAAKTPNSAATSRLDVPQIATPRSADSRLKFAPLFRPETRDGAQSEPRPKRQPPSSTRLRQKPINELKLSDFKPNPIYNQGYSFAFAETVRKRADRACLMGCTRPECCGSTFRALAAAAAPLSSSQEEKLLEEHLGDAYDSMQLTQMSPEERHELILQARTRELANKHGKHRHAYERQTTPPGFWRVDFPTTQEDREDREKAAQLEKKAIMERRAEALRKGGRYVFRDE
jgi:hypothetical protein